MAYEPEPVHEPHTLEGGAARAELAREQASAPRRPGLAELLASIPDAELGELFRFWVGRLRVPMPSEPGALRAQVLAWMLEPEILGARLSEMGRRHASILDAHLAAPRHELCFADLATHKQLAYLSSYDLEASLAVLMRHGLLAATRCKEVARYGARSHAVPAELAERILRLRRARERGIFDLVTLKGHLDRQCSDPERPSAMSPARVRELYKLYANETAAVARIERLPEGLRGMIEKVILQFGGILARGLFERMETDLPRWDGRRWSRLLEESLIGTVSALDLTRYGLAHNDDTLVVFNEVALAWLRRVAVPSDPDAPHQEASLGVDLVSNISRFIAFILDHDVRFTVRGEIFKTTEKRILSDLIPNPGRELSRSEVLDFIYRFARRERLIESTGERTFALTPQGRGWEPLSLEEKLRRLLDHALEERELGGDYYHQLRLRRIYLRLLKRVEPGVWYDLMYLPFLARNTYLASLDDMAVEEDFAARAQNGGYTPLEDLQRLAWNLVSWVRRRLYLLGIVDLGYDTSGRPVAIRLARSGARLLGLAADLEAPAALGNLVVTPDFEVVLFPTGDDAELVHDLDRFCRRERAGNPMHFRIDEKGLNRALAEGMHLRRILRTLESNSRTPVPQNVVYTIRDWAARAGLLFLGADRIVRCANPETLKRFLSDPGVRPHVTRVLDEGRVLLCSDSTPRRLQSLLRELDYLVELEEG